MVAALDDDGNTLLHKAAEGETACMERLLAAAGAQDALVIQNAEGDTPLMAAIRYEDASLVKLLLNSDGNAGRATAAATEEAVSLARELDLPEVISALTVRCRTCDSLPTHRVCTNASVSKSRCSS